MSDWGTVQDKLITLAEAAVAGLVSERGLRLSKDLRPEDFPHLFVYDPTENTTVLPFQQESIQVEYQLLILTRADTQEQIQQ